MPELVDLRDPPVATEVALESVPSRTTRPLPSWFVVALVAVSVWIATAGTVGIALLAYASYSAKLTSALATLAAVAAAVGAGRWLGPRPRADHVAAIGAVVLVAVSFGLSSAFHSEHYLADRDPAIYITTGRAIARYHELAPKTHLGPFAARTFGNPQARYLANFFPMLPVLLALGWSAGGDSAMLLVGPLLGAFGLLACFALASKVMGPRWGLLALAILAISAPQIWFSRDAFSELVVQVVVLSGLWLFLEARERSRWGLAAIAGALVATSALARIDALAIVFGAIVFVAAEWVRCDTDPTPTSARRVVGAFGLALVGATLVTIAPTHNVAEPYIHALGAEYRQLFAAFFAAIAGLVAVVLLHRLRPGLGRWFVERRTPFAVATAAFTVLFVWAYVWRPAPASQLPRVANGRVANTAVTRAINQWHFTWSLHWFSAYYGVIGLALAFAGFVMLAARARRGSSAAAAVFLVVVPVAVMYIARPSIQSGQPWAMRRYLPVVIPGIAIAIAFALQWGCRAARARNSAMSRAVVGGAVVVVAIGALAPTVASALPFTTARAQHGAESAIHHICAVTGDDSAVFVARGGYLSDELPNPLHMFCGVPTAVANEVNLAQTARQWHAAGRRFLVATVAPDAVVKSAPGSKIVGHFPVSDDVDPERVFDRAPSRFAPVPVDIWLVEVPPGPA